MFLNFQIQISRTLFYELRHFIGNILLETFAYPFKGNALEDGVEETLHNDLLGFGLRDTTRLEIEERLLFQLANCRAMRTADIIRKDLQTRNGICPCPIAQDQIPVRLISVCFLRAGRDVDHALPDGSALTFQRALE